MIRGYRDLKINEVIDLLEQTLKHKQGRLQTLKQTESLPDLANRALKSFATMSQSQWLVSKLLEYVQEGVSSESLRGWRRKLEEKPYAVLAKVALISFGVGVFLNFINQNGRARRK